MTSLDDSRKTGINCLDMSALCLKTLCRWPLNLEPAVGREETMSLKAGTESEVTEYHATISRYRSLVRF